VKFKDALLSILIIEVGIAVLAVMNYGVTLESLQAVTRFSGRASLAIFSLIFLFQKHRYIKLTSILSDKYYLIFAIVHGIHLAQLLTFIYLSGNKLIPVSLAGGFVAYLIIFIMPYAQHRLKVGNVPLKQFATLNLVFLYYVWFSFFYELFAKSARFFTQYGWILFRVCNLTCLGIPYARYEVTEFTYEQNLK